MMGRFFICSQAWSIGMTGPNNFKCSAITARRCAVPYF
jgi:hypothetical protein